MRELGLKVISELLKVTSTSNSRFQLRSAERPTLSRDHRAHGLAGCSSAEHLVMSSGPSHTPPGITRRLSRRTPHGSPRRACDVGVSGIPALPMRRPASLPASDSPRWTRDPQPPGAGIQAATTGLPSVCQMQGLFQAGHLHDCLYWFSGGTFVPLFLSLYLRNSHRLTILKRVIWWHLGRSQCHLSEVPEHSHPPNKRPSVRQQLTPDPRLLRPRAAPSLLVCLGRFACSGHSTE